MTIEEEHLLNNLEKALSINQEKKEKINLRNDDKINLPIMTKPFFDRRGEKRSLSGAKTRLFNEVYRKMAKSECKFIFLSFLKEQADKILTEDKGLLKRLA